MSLRSVGAFPRWRRHRRRLARLFFLCSRSRHDENRPRPSRTRAPRCTRMGTCRPYRADRNNTRGGSAGTGTHDRAHRRRGIDHRRSEPAGVGAVTCSIRNPAFRVPRTSSRRPSGIMRCSRSAAADIAPNSMRDCSSIDSIGRAGTTIFVKRAGISGAGNARGRRAIASSRSASRWSRGTRMRSASRSWSTNANGSARSAATGARS